MRAGVGRPVVKRWGRRAAAVFVFTVVAGLATATSAMANIRGELQRFSECPFNSPIVGGCLYSATTSGEFVVGKGTVPITKTIILQAGLNTEGELIPPENGNELSKTPLQVPGGLVGIELPGNFTEVTATAEMAGKGSYVNSINLPLKVKLDNIALGGNCRIGSESEPLSLHLTYETTNPPPPNKPISGKVTLSQRGPVTVLTGTLVDNAFAAPGANGCTLLPLVGDLAVNLKEGLPAAAGNNTAIMTGVTELVPATTVKAILPLPELGRCTKVEGVREGGRLVYHGAWSTNCGIELPEKNGKWEWAPGPGAARKFKAVSKTVKLETVGKTAVTCTASTSEGEYTGAKTQVVVMKLTGCKQKTTPCQSSSTAGEIQTAALDGSLDFIKENLHGETPIVGVDLTPASGSKLATFECGGKAMSLSGSVIVPVTVLDKPEAFFHAIAAATAGKQLPEAFEEGPKDTLTLASSGGEEQAGLTATMTVTNGETLEIKSLPN
jgi:hypothetical protein